ncbi:MAG: 3-deoxy-D-manno-octulosonic acid transferase [Colwellia sp.]
MIALFLYRITLLLLFPVVMLLLVIRSRSNPAYRQNLKQRLGLFPKPVATGGIVVHAASVGEVLALKGFIEQLLIEYSHLPITVTTFTPTGAEQVKKIFGNRVQQGYLPLDILPCTTLFLHRVKPKMVIFMETELWPNLISQCGSRDIKLLLINGRLSDKSIRSYKKLSSLIKPTLKAFDSILTQSSENFDNFIELGANKAKCNISGNLKFDIKVDAALGDKQVELQSLLPKNRPILLLASSHQGDEAMMISTLKNILDVQPEVLLVIVPRHPERFESVANLCLEKGLTLTKRSANTPVTTENIWLLDTLGELMPALACVDIVIMGGSFSSIGGHNPLEPALFRKPIVVGNDMSNFREVTEQLLAEKGMIQINHLNNASDHALLTDTLLNLLEEPEQRSTLGDNALKVVKNNQGATQNTINTALSLLPSLVQDRH